MTCTIRLSRDKTCGDDEPVLLFIQHLHKACCTFEYFLYVGLKEKNIQRDVDIKETSHPCSHSRADKVNRSHSDGSSGEDSLGRDNASTNQLECDSTNLNQRDTSVPDVARRDTSVSDVARRHTSVSEVASSEDEFSDKW